MEIIFLVLAVIALAGAIWAGLNLLVSELQKSRNKDEALGFICVVCLIIFLLSAMIGSSFHIGSNHKEQTEQVIQK